MEDQLIEGLEPLKSEVGETLAEEWMEKMKENLRDAEQGAHLLVEAEPVETPRPGFFTDIEQVGDDFVFRIQHPTATLHEIGGHIEPKYSQMMARGWTRDAFYEGLKDCEDYVYKKQYASRAAYELKREYES